MELGNIIKKGIKNVFFGIAGIKNVKKNSMVAGVPARSIKKA